MLPKWWRAFGSCIPTSPMTLGDSERGTAQRNFRPLGKDCKAKFTCFSSSDPVHDAWISWMEVPSRLVLAASCLNVLERSQVLSVVKLYECFKKNSLLASFAMSESWLNTWSGLSWVFWTREGSLASWGWGGPPQSSFLSGSTHRHALHRIWWRVPSFGPMRLFGCWCGGTSCSWLFFWGRSPVWRDKWRWQRCLPNKMW